MKIQVIGLGVCREVNICYLPCAHCIHPVRGDHVLVALAEVSSVYLPFFFFSDKVLIVRFFLVQIGGQGIEDVISCTDLTKLVFGLYKQP